MEELGLDGIWNERNKFILIEKTKIMEKEYQNKKFLLGKNFGFEKLEHKIINI